MRRFHLGDEVRVVGLPNSQWQDRQGTVVEMFPQQPEAGHEYAVAFGTERRWFLDKHLVKSVPAKLVRFFRAEALNRWQLCPDDVSTLNGDIPELARLLCDRLDFAIRRAGAEAEDFYKEFNERIARAVYESPSKESAAYNTNVSNHTNAA